MISYIEKGAGLHDAIRDAGHVLRQENGVWVSSNDVEVQSIIDSYSLSDAIAHKSVFVDEKAERLRNKFLRGVSPGEMSSWSIKKAEADKFQVSKSNSDAPNIVAEAGFRGVSVQNLVNKILTNFDNVIQRESRIAGISGKHKDNLKSLLSFDDINSYDFSNGWPIS